MTSHHRKKWLGFIVGGLLVTVALGAAERPNILVIRDQQSADAPSCRQEQRRESLVDLEKDPGETTNLAAEPAFAKGLTEHRALLRTWSRGAHD